MRANPLLYLLMASQLILVPAFVVNDGRVGTMKARRRLPSPTSPTFPFLLGLSSSSPRQMGDFADEIGSARSEALQQQLLLLALPFLSGIVSFITYDTTWQTFHSFVEYFSGRSFVVVDGGMLQAQSIIPVLNGPVLAAVGLLLATLVSMTISSLYQRQTSVRASVLQEVEELRYLQQLLQGFPDDVRQKVKCNVDAYTDRLFKNVIARTGDPLRAVGNTALKDLIFEMNAHVDGSSGVAAELISQFYSTVTRIKAERSKRITAKASIFPATHYILLGLLACSICLAFLLESNQKVSFFLDEFELSLCWAVLNGAFCSLAVVLYDLNTFSGSYSLFGSDDALIHRFYRYAKNEDDGE